MHEKYEPNMLSLNETALVMLPSRLFDPLWLKSDRKDHSDVDLVRHYHEINTVSLRATLLWNRLRKAWAANLRWPPSEIPDVRIQENDAIFPGALTVHWHGGLRGPRGAFRARKSDTLLSRIEAMLSPSRPGGKEAAVGGRVERNAQAYDGVLEPYVYAVGFLGFGAIPGRRVLSSRIPPRVLSCWPPVTRQKKGQARACQGL